MVVYSSTKEQVEDEILRRIRFNIYNKDSIISEARLCEELNVSRTPVREALIHLSASNLLKKFHRKAIKSETLICRQN